MHYSPRNPGAAHKEGGKGCRWLGLQLFGAGVGGGRWKRGVAFHHGQRQGVSNPGHWPARPENNTLGRRQTPSRRDFLGPKADTSPPIQGALGAEGRGQRASLPPLRSPDPNPCPWGLQLPGIASPSPPALAAPCCSACPCRAGAAGPDLQAQGPWPRPGAAGAANP